VSYFSEKRSPLPKLETVFLDRDGTINVKAPEGAYIAHPQQLVLLPGAAAAIRMLNDHGILALVVTNQRGVGRGLMSPMDLDRVHVRLRTLLAREQARVDGIYVCPHEKDVCACRKPQAGLIWQAIQETPGIRLASAAMVGDAASDVELGRRLGITTVQISGCEADTRKPDHTSPDLLSAVRWLLAVQTVNS
jgi:D-glycero-D-manno-heptose 1,7-bisphosphate phosphatase